MSHPLCWPHRSPFMILGDSLAISLTQDLAPEKANVDILVLQCNDVYTILFTLYMDMFAGPGLRKMDVTCSEVESSVTARNALVFTLLYDEAPINQIWNIYYHFRIDESNSALLTAQSRKLADASSQPSQRLMSFPLCWTHLAPTFKPLGSSPAISLTQDASPEQPNVDILILQCNDVYNILFTLYMDVFVGPGPRKMDVTCSEMEPAVIARNALAFTLLYAEAPINQIWNIYYHFRIDESTSTLLTTHSRKLADASVSLDTWAQSPYYAFIKIVDQNTLDEVHKLWSKYANFPDIPDETLREIKSDQNDMMNMVVNHLGSNQNSSAARSTTLVWSTSTIEVSDEFKRFWRTGTTNKPSSGEDKLNPTWLYSGQGDKVSVHPGSFPEVYHLVDAFIPDKRDPKRSLPSCLDKARQQFKAGCESFQASIRAANITLRFYVGDPLPFALSLQSKSESNQHYANPWDARSIDLSPHFASSPPEKFDIIDATRFIDTHGLWNLITAVQPLLASTSSILYTEAHSKSEQQASMLFYERTCSDLPTFSLLSGLVPRAFISQFGSQSNSHELVIFDADEHDQRVAWVSADPCPPSVPIGVKFSVTDIADALFYIYRGMHFFDDSPEFYVPMRLSRLRDCSQLAYNRETVARIVRHVQSRGQVHLTNGGWQDVAKKIIQLIQGNTLTYQDDRHLEDLKLQLQLCNLLPLPKPANPTGVFAGWNEVPPIVCLVLKIPASAKQLKVLKDYNEIIPARLTCIIRKSANDKKPQMFSSLHAVWGTLLSSEAEHTIEPDTSGQGINGTSDMIISFWVPSMLLEGKDTTVSLAFRYTALIHRLYNKSHGHDLDIFKTQVVNKEHVLVLRSRPMKTPHKQLVPLLPTPPPPSSVATCECKSYWRGDRWYVKDITARHNVIDTGEKSSLAGGAKVSIQLVGPCRLRLSVDKYEHIVVIPFPAKETDITTRIARKSGYIEMVTVPYQPWYGGGYPPTLFPVLLDPPRPWNVHHLPLDKLQLIDVADAQKTMEYILPLMALQHSDRERKIMFNPNYVPGDHLHALKVGVNILVHDYIGFEFRGPPFEVFALRPMGAGVQMILLIGGIRSDSAGGTIVLDTAVIPVTAKNKATVLPLLDPIGEAGVLIMSVDVRHGEMGAWKQYLAACVERARTWTHKPACEYQTAGRVPISLEDGGESLCTCGNGIGFEGREWIPPEAPKWQQLLPYATRAGVSPIFSVPYLEIVGGEVYKDMGYGRQPPSTTPLNGCWACTKSGVPLSVCGRSKRADNMILPTTLDPQAIVQKLCEKIGGASTQATQVVKKAEIVTKPTGAKPPLHALIIGINKYKANVHLSAAVPDAQTFKAYLTDELLVPEQQITMILDEQAKRADIIQAFQDLAKPDNGINKGDPIVIYYAGHGSELKPPPDREANGPLVQCIIPQDTSKTDGVVPIPDFTIGTLVHRIAQEKGNNITLIFDCCHSAGGSRDTPEDARYIDKTDLPELPASPDKDIIQDALSGSRDIVDPSSLGLSFEGMDSHVIMAACGHGEVAYENGVEKHGYFSSALLKLLRSVKVDSLTYKGCMQRLPALRTRNPQNPVCEGKNMDRLFFNAMVPGANTTFIVIKPNKSKEFYLQAGLAQGITPGSKFAIHESDIMGPTNPTLGTLEVDKVDPFVARLKDANTLKLPAVCYGRQVGYGPEQALDIYVTQEFVDAAEPDEVWARAFSGGEEQLVMRPVEQDLAAVVLSVNANKETNFILNHPASVQYGIQTLPAPCYSPISPSAPYVIPVLTALSQWNWHLRRVPDSRPFQKTIDLEFYKLRLTGEYTDEGSQILEPEGENLSVDGVVDFVASNDDYYGLRVVNRSNADLYANLFAFSATSLAIAQKTIPILGSSSSDPTLPKNAPLTIGYGSGGQVPFMFAVNEGMNFDITMLKLFVSNTPTDFSSLEQESPFEGRGVVSDSGVKDMFGKKPVWDAFTLTLVQRRYPKGEEPAPEGTTTKPVEPEPTPVPVPAPAPVPEPTPAPGPGTTTAGPTLFTGRSEDPASAQARSAAAVNSTWFRTPALTKELLESIRCMRLRTLAKQQGPSGATATAQTGAYFEISVVSPADGLPKLTPSGTEMTYRSHSAPAKPDYEWTDGQVFDETHELWSGLAVGDYFEVAACASGRGWTNDADRGNLIFW
ncbi:unnamed protein product [Rhizoctonia solani]|uniref:Uncharacterized protein n=1 Tax=Rhizoctonia solani TaxID=456999 RepID=A0A8H3HBF6_9AGAM|nr:unnamed protein product [Rhizoctonia solani]